MDESGQLWQHTCQLLTSCGVDSGLERVFPEPIERACLLDALQSVELAASPAAHQSGQRLAQQLSAVVTQAQTINQIGKCPVVGITGLLNSGKSSLLSAYLSESGRRRVLRGSANNQGTHRFVLWLPDIWWNDQALLQVLRQYMRDLFSCDAELLSDQPDIAFAQYNGQLSGEFPRDQDPLAVPLLAHDGGLNDLGLALLDCPDIQSAFARGAHPTDQDAELDAELAQAHRRQMLGRVGRLCSAFLVVCKLSSLHDETLISIFETLRDTMPGVKRILAVNKVKARYWPDVVEEQAQGLVEQFGITDVYMAYDFRSHWAEHRLPPPPEGWNAQAEPLPIFFKAVRGSQGYRAPAPSSHDDNQLPGMRPPKVERYLQHLSSLLDPGSLVVEGRRSILDQLTRLSREALAWVTSNQNQRARQLHDAWQMIADACLAFMAQRDEQDQTVGLRLQTSPAIVAQMSDSLVKSAPWTMRPSLMIDRSVRHLQTSIVGGVKRMRWLQSVSSSLTQFVSSFRKGHTGKVVTADRFRQQLEKHDYHLILANWPGEALGAACEQALSRFQKEDTSRLDQAWLDRWSAEVWKSMPLKRKLYVGMMPLAPIFGPLLAVTLIPFDGGGTAVVVFATTKELLLAAGIAAVVTPTMTGGEVQDIVERETALAQLSELFAITCDALGVPRPEVGSSPTVKVASTARELAVSQLSRKPPASSYSLAQWQLVAKFEQQLTKSLDALRIGLDSQ